MFNTIIKFTLTAVFIGFTSPVFSQTNKELSDNLRSFLETRTFKSLLEEYKEEKLVLSNTGRKAQVKNERSYNVKEGYRVQVYATIEKQMSDAKAVELKQRIANDVYVIESDGLYKLQVGNYTKRTDAEALLQQLKSMGYSGAWVTQGDIHVNKTAAEINEYRESQNKRVQEFYSEQQFLFAIQVFATGDSVKAFDMAAKLQNDLQQSASVMRQGNVWKVLIGRFEKRADAEQLLRNLKRQRYADAWITQIAT